VRNASSLQILGKTEKFSINVKVVVLGHMLNVVKGNFWIYFFLFAKCV
jgi:hypothetical protein